MRQLTASERLAIANSVDQSPTPYEEDLLAFWKLYPGILADPLHEGEEPRREYVFGVKEAELRTRKKFELFFSNRSPKTHEITQIRNESELERLEIELIFLKRLLENNSSMKKNAALAEKITLLSIYINKVKKRFANTPVPEFKGCGF